MSSVTSSYSSIEARLENNSLRVHKRWLAVYIHPFIDMVDLDPYDRLDMIAAFLRDEKLMKEKEIEGVPYRLSILSLLSDRVLT